MNVLSLFSGVGGFDLGLENAKMKTIYQCEWDKHATRILERHWPQVPRWGDISTLTGKEILSHGTPPDVVAWGSPCQDLSVAGKRAGLEGERSGLFHEGIRIINEIRKETNNEYPKISIWENVAGTLSSNRGADFGVILDEMAKAGAMVIEWGLLDAQHFGIPQRRRRVFVIAIFNPATASLCPSPLLPLSESLRGDTKKSKPKRKSAANTLTESFGAGGGIVNAIGASIYHHGTVVNQDVGSGHLVVGALAARDYKGVGSQYVDEGKVIVEQSAYAFDSLSSNSMKSSNPDSGCNQVDVAKTLDTWRPDPSLNQGGIAIVEEPMLSFATQFGSNANVFEDQSPTLKASQAAPSVAYGIQGNVIGRQDHNGPGGTGVSKEDGPMFTLTKTDIHAVATLMAVRRLTPLECERLMGWPDDHTRYDADGTEQADTHRYKQCGNGVASPVAEWIGKQLMKLVEVAQ